MQAIRHAPKVGYLLKKLSETFILNEIVQLERTGISLHFLSLKKPPLYDKFHPAVSEVQANVTCIRLRPRLARVRHFLRSNVRSGPLDATSTTGEHFQLFIRSPIRYVSAVWFHLRAPGKRRLKEFLHAGLVTRCLQRRNIGHLHAHFANVPTSVAELVHRFSGITFTFTAHAKDIYLHRHRELARKMEAVKFVLTCTGYNKTYPELIVRLHPDLPGVPRRGSGPLSSSRYRATAGRTAATPEHPPFLRNEGLRISNPGMSDSEGAGPDVFLHDYRLRALGDQLRSLIAELDLGSHVSLVPEMAQDGLVEMYRRPTCSSFRVS